MLNCRDHLPFAVCVWKANVGAFCIHCLQIAVCFQKNKELYVLRASVMYISSSTMRIVVYAATAVPAHTGASLIAEPCAP